MKNFRFIFVSICLMSVCTLSFGQSKCYTASVSEKVGDNEATIKELSSQKLQTDLVDQIWKEMEKKDLFVEMNADDEAQVAEARRVITKNLNMIIKKEEMGKKYKATAESCIDLGEMAQKVHRGEVAETPAPVEEQKAEVPAEHSQLVGSRVVAEQVPATATHATNNGSIESAELLFMEAAASYKQGKIELAIEQYNKGLAINNSYAKPYFELGNIYYEQAKYAEAVGAYQQAIALEGDNANVYFNMGNAYLDAQDYDNAILTYQKALTVDANDKATLYNLAIAYFQKGDHSQTIFTMQRAARAGNRDAQLWLQANGLSW